MQTYYTHDEIQKIQGLYDAHRYLDAYRLTERAWRGPRTLTERLGTSGLVPAGQRRNLRTGGLRPAWAASKGWLAWLAGAGLAVCRGLAVKRWTPMPWQPAWPRWKRTPRQ